MDHDNRTENGSSWADRPYSAKFPNLKPKGSRPSTASRSNIARRGKGRVEVPRANGLHYSAEELFERVQELKSTLNEVREENLKLKTKVKLLEKENRRDDNEVDRTSMVTTLKHQLKDAAKVIEQKDRELMELRRNSRSTKLAEIDVELKVYKDECTRLRRILEEAMMQLTQGAASSDLQERYIQLSVQYKALKREHGDLSLICDELKNTKHSKKKEDIFEALKRSLLDTKEENSRLLDENHRLLGALQMSAGSCPNCAVQDCSPIADMQTVREADVLFLEIWKHLEFRRLEAGQLWHLVAADQQNVGAQGLLEGLQHIDVILNLIEASVVLDVLAPGLENASRQDFIAGMLTQRPTELISFSEADPSLRHFSMRLQIRRWPKEQVPSLFASHEQQLSKQTVAEILSNEPVDLDQEDVITVIEFLYVEEATLPCEVFLQRLMLALDDWDVLSEQDEARLDEDLKRLLQSFGNFIQKCEEVDVRRTGVITLQSFAELFKGYQIKTELLHYLALICYTDQCMLDTLPYTSLSKVYIQEVYEPTGQQQGSDQTHPQEPIGYKEQRAYGQEKTLVSLGTEAHQEASDIEARQHTLGAEERRDTHATEERQDTLATEERPEPLATAEYREALTTEPLATEERREPHGTREHRELLDTEERSEALGTVKRPRSS
jgi:hypothetical protein